jgi:hypothetical protein
MLFADIVVVVMFTFNLDNENTAADENESKN